MAWAQAPCPAATLPGVGLTDAAGHQPGTVPGSIIDRLAGKTAVDHVGYPFDGQAGSATLVVNTIRCGSLAASAITLCCLSSDKPPCSVATGTGQPR
mgnify:CR=1 FL=1